MIVAEAALIAAWILLLATVWFEIKLLLRNTWVGTTIGVLV